MSGHKHNPLNRFSDRVADYVRYRPGYPAEILTLLRSEIGVSDGSVVADIGSGTGIFTAAILALGARVFAVEPNAEMRKAAESALSGRDYFVSVDASAERTGLPSGSVDLITAAQAFHWFEPEPTRAEFQRILKPGGQALFVWNDRLTDATPFLRDYEGLLKEFGTDYDKVNHRNLQESDAITSFFAPAAPASREFDNRQDFDFEGLKGRLLSSSYAPNAGHATHDPMLQELRRIFDRHQRQGKVAFLYTTLVYFGPLPARA